MTKSYRAQIRETPDSPWIDMGVARFKSKEEADQVAQNTLALSDRITGGPGEVQVIECKDEANCTFPAKSKSDKAKHAR